MKNIKKIFYVSFVLIINFICVNFVLAAPYIKNESYSNFDKSVLSCGNRYLTGIPALIPKVISIAYVIIQIAVPVILVIFGMLDLLKAIYASKEDEIKKSQQIFVKRIITAALIFFVFVIVKLIISLVAEGNSNEILDCAECFISNKCDK